jgi:mRNA degradation ribonuclease J1/J2
VVVNLAVDKFTNKPMKQPEIISRGFIVWNDSQDIQNTLRNRIAETAARANGNLQKDLEQMIGNFLYSETHRRPMVLVNVIKA